MSVEEENENVKENCCLICQKEINEKPWITVQKDGQKFIGCSYSCGVNFHTKIGCGYWNYVVNKEDFNEPRPILNYQTKKDITTGFGMDDIREEIEEEEIRMNLIEQEYEEYSSSEENFDEENYY